MPPAGNLARRIVDYDRDFAAGVLRLVVAELHGPEDEQDLDRIHAWLAHATSDSEVSRTTMEWKAGFARRERLRVLGAELAELLRAAG